MRRLALPLPIGCKGAINQDYMSAKKVEKLVKRKPRGKAKVSSKTALPSAKEFKTYRPANAFPVGNDLWKLRNKTGAKRFFESPVDMLQEFERYVSWALENPIISAKPVIEEGVATLQDVPLRRPITVGAFCFVIGCNEDYLRNFRGDVRKNPKLADFGPVIDAIYQYVEEVLTEGAAVGQFNANLISRKLGLADRSDITTGGEKIQTSMPELTIKIENNTPGFANAEAEIKDKKK